MGSIYLNSPVIAQAMFDCRSPCFGLSLIEVDLRTDALVLDKWGGMQPLFRSDGGDAMKQHRLVWTEEWTTSIAWLDDEHRDLVDYYHAVVDALREDEVGVFLARLRELREWLSLHFNNEESALQQMGCREAYRHREDHQQFIDTLDDFACNSKKVYGYQERLAVARYIFYWLIRHGKAYDAQITLHLQHRAAMN